MELQLALDAGDVLLVHLRDGDDRATVSVRPARAGAASFVRALDEALVSGYAECFWPGVAEGQTWWIFKRDAESLETIAMWTRGGATGWEHVFRATDAAAWVRDRLDAELARLGLR